jgi:hypothetical protein
MLLSLIVHFLLQENNICSSVSMNITVIYSSLLKPTLNVGLLYSCDEYTGLTEECAGFDTGALTLSPHAQQ